MPRRIVIHRPGGHDRLRIEPFELGTRAPGHVRIQADAIGVNYADCVARMGLYASAAKYVGWPLVPGFEVAGRVLEHDAASAWRVGDEVVAVTRFGGYATQLDVPEHQVFPRPRVGSGSGSGAGSGLGLGLGSGSGSGSGAGSGAGAGSESASESASESDAPRLCAAEAAGLPTVYATAWYALFELASITRGQRLLVHSGAGGVGGAILQLARRAGCETVAVVGRTDKVDVARALGATHVIDKSREPLWPRARALAPRGYDVVLDANGAETLSRSYESLGSPGRLVVYGFHTMLPRRGGRPSWPRLALSWLRTPRFDPLRMTSENRSVLAFNLSYLFERRPLLERAMSEIWSGLERGELRALPTRTFAFDDVAAAHAALESGTTTGKLVLTVSQ